MFLRVCTRTCVCARVCVVWHQFWLPEKVFEDFQVDNHSLVFCQRLIRSGPSPRIFKQSLPSFIWEKKNVSVIKMQQILFKCYLWLYISIPNNWGDQLCLFSINGPFVSFSLYVIFFPHVKGNYLLCCTSDSFIFLTTANIDRTVIKKRFETYSAKKTLLRKTEMESRMEDEQMLH